MAKRLLLDVLVHVLGEFVELNEADLSVAVWSGKVSLRRLRLKLNSPLQKHHFNLSHGLIDTLELTVPWASLMSSPLKLRLDGLLLGIEPVDKRNFDPEQVLRTLLAEKLAALKAWDTNLSKTLATTGEESGSGGGSGDGWGKQLITKIVNNLEVSISAIHLRYEDKLTLPSQRFAVGITLASFSVTSCDEQWRAEMAAAASGVKSDAMTSPDSAAAVESAMRKLAQVAGLAVYWDTDCEILNSLPEDAWKTAMLARIAGRPGGALSPTGVSFSPRVNSPQYILSPGENNLSLRVTLQKEETSASGEIVNAEATNGSNGGITDDVGRGPRLSLEGRGTSIHVALDSIQVQQSAALFYRLSSVERIRHPLALRPSDRPLVSRRSLREWWKYAFNLVRIRSRYVDIYKRRKRSESSHDIEDKEINEGNGEMLSESADRVTDEELRQVCMWEEQLSLEVLKQFRQQALTELFKEQRLVSGSMSTTQSTANTNPSGGWLSYLGYGKAATSAPQSRGNVGVDDIEVDTLIASMVTERESGFARTLLSSFRVTIAASGSLLLSSRGKGLVTCELATTVRMAKSGRLLSMGAVVTDLSVSEVIGICPFHRQLVTVQSVSSTDTIRSDSSKVNGTNEDEEADPLCTGWGTAWDVGSAWGRSSWTAKPNPNDKFMGSSGNKKSEGHKESRSSSPPTLAVTFDILRSGRKRLKVTSQPIELFVNRLVIQYLLAEFSPPPRPVSQPAARRHAVISAVRPSVGLRDLQQVILAGTQELFGNGTEENDIFDEESERKSDPESKTMSRSSSKDQLSSHSVKVSTLPTLPPPLEEDEDELEIIFKAYGPKIVLPLDPVHDAGYLLIDCGRLDVLGNHTQSTGFTLSAVLTALNVGAPRHLGEISELESLSLYVIRPFSVRINMGSAQDCGDSGGDAERMITVAVEPAIQGDVDREKLGRVLSVLGGIGEIFVPLVPPWVKATISSTIASSNVPISPPDKPASRVTNVPSTSTASNRRHSTGAVLVPSLLSNSDFESNSPPFTGAADPRRRSMPLYGGGSGADILSGDTSGPGNNSPVDPSRVKLRIKVTIERVALDLTYASSSTTDSVSPAPDGSRGSGRMHMWVSGLALEVVSRPYDRLIAFRLAELRIEDSRRSASQRCLVYTPHAHPSMADQDPNSKGSNNSGTKNSYGDLVDISVLSTSSFLSPYGARYATEVEATFAELVLCIDVVTIQRLQPFIEVLLQKRSSQSTTSNVATASSGLSNTVMGHLGLKSIPSTSDSPNSFDNSTKESLKASRSKSMLPTALISPSGLNLKVTFRLVTFELLRASHDREALGTPLEPAFSLRAGGMELVISTDDLLSSTLQLGTFEILDERPMARDYVFRALFTPASSVEAMTDNVPFSRDVGSDDTENEVPALLVLRYHQESKSLSFLTARVADIASFVAIDAIVDFATIAAHNFFAITGLFSTPDPPALPPPPPATLAFLNASSPRNDTILKNARETRGTMNVSATLGCLRFVFLEDPAIRHSRALVGQCALQVSYTREHIWTTFHLPPITTISPADCDVLGEEVTSHLLIESLHATVADTRISVCRSMATPGTSGAAVLEPMDVEYHYKKQTRDERAILASHHLELDDIIARLSFHELHLLAAIFRRRALAQQTFTPTKTHEQSSGASSSEAESNITDRQSLQPNEDDDTNDQTPLWISRPAKYIHCGLNSLTLTLTHDSPNLSSTSSVSIPAAVPILRLSIDDSTFFAEGKASLLPPNSGNSDNENSYTEEVSILLGEGGAVFKIDFYNSTRLCWEPFLEAWKASLRYELTDSTSFHHYRQTAAMIPFGVSNSSQKTRKSKNSDNVAGSIGDLHNFKSPLSWRGEASWIEIRSEHSLQLSLSGQLLETFLRSASLFAAPTPSATSLLSHGSSVPGTGASSVGGSIIVNDLGDGVNVNLIDSVSQHILHELSHGERYQLTALSAASFAVSADTPLAGTRKNYRWMDRTGRLPTTVDLELGGIFSGRMPLRGLPLNATESRGYLLRTPGTTVDDSRMVSVLEAVEEEVYENSRFDPLSAKWRRPFLFGDPYEYTDASCSQRRDLKAVPLSPLPLVPTSHKTSKAETVNIDGDAEGRMNWDWVSPQWQIDLNGEVGSEIDEDGWSYAANFTHFTTTSSRRTQQSLDFVRRRRWIRSRLPRLSSSAQAAQPLPIFWDVAPQSDAGRIITIRSGLQVDNSCSFDVMASFSHPTWPREKVILRIAAGETFNVPLALSIATRVRFRPSPVPQKMSTPLENTNSNGDSLDNSSFDSGFGWSPYFSCHQPSYDLCTCRDCHCAESDTAVFFRVLTTHQSRSLRLSLLPHLTLHNKLLSDLHFAFRSDVTSRPELGAICSGETTSLSHICVQPTSPPLFALQIGGYEWSAERKLRPGATETLSVELSRSRGDTHSVEGDISRSHSTGGRNDSLTVLVSICTDVVTRRVIVEVYYQMVVIDRTGLGLAIRSLNEGGRKSHIRHLRPRHLLHSSPTSENSTAPSSSGKLSSTNIVTISVLHPMSPSNEVTRLSLGSSLFSDHPSYRWVHLPYYLLDQASLRLPSSSRRSRAANLVSIRLTHHKYKAFMLVVLVDSRASLPWLSETEGYLKMDGIAVARKRSSGGGSTLQSSSSASILTGGSGSTEVTFHLYARRVTIQDSENSSAGCEVTLGGGWDPSGALMYAVVALPYSEEGCYDNPLCRRFAFEDSYSTHQVREAWAEGTAGLSAFYTESHTLSVAVAPILPPQLPSNVLSTDTQRPQVTDLQSLTWSENLLTDSSRVSSPHGSFSLPCPRSGITYQLAYRLTQLPGLYSNTQLLVFLPQICVLSTLAEPLFVAQLGSHRHVEFLPFAPEGWHQVDSLAGIEVKFRTLSSLWSLGSVNLMEIGSSVLFLPFAQTNANDGSSAFVGGNSQKGGGGIVLHVEVKLASPSDNCSLIVVVWQETIDGAALSILNETDLPITVCQADIATAHDLSADHLSVSAVVGPSHDSGKANVTINQTNLPAQEVSSGLAPPTVSSSSAGPKLFEQLIPPHRHLPFGWADPDLPPVLLIAVGYDVFSTRRALSLHILQDVTPLRLSYTTETGTIAELLVWLTVTPMGRVLRVTYNSVIGGVNSTIPLGVSNHPSSLKPSKLTTRQASSREDTLLSIHLSLASVGISLLAERPIRRELLSVYIDDVHSTFRLSGKIHTVEVSVRDLQLDNYCETAVYPVLLRSTKKELRSVHVAGGEDMNEDLEWKRAENLGGFSEGSAEGVDIGDQPFLQFSVVSEKIEGKAPPILHYVALRILPLAMEVDSGTLRILFLDVFDGLKALDRATVEAVASPSHWLNSFSYNALLPALTSAPLFQWVPASHMGQDNTISTGTEGGRWITAVSLERGEPLIDIHATLAAARSMRLFIRSLVIHPMKITFTLYQTTLVRPSTSNHSLTSALNSSNLGGRAIPGENGAHGWIIASGNRKLPTVYFSSNGATINVQESLAWSRYSSGPSSNDQSVTPLQSNLLNALLSLVGVEKLQLKLSSYTVEQLYETPGTLLSLLTLKTTQDIRSQLGQIAGSLALIGSPVGLMRKVGSGVKAFFYEPYQGVVHGGSTELALSGLRRGTDRLVRHVVVGTMDSTAAFMGTASRSMSYLSGDLDYTHRRALKQQENLARRGGLYDGLVNSGESLISGVSSGVQGLIRRPYEEASKSGVGGFFRGLGLGVLGAAIKPLVGVTEGLTSLAQGISMQVDPSAGDAKHVRPPRVLGAISAGPGASMSEGRLTPLDLDAAFAQRFVCHRARQHGYTDHFVDFIPLPSMQLSGMSTTSSAGSLPRQNGSSTGLGGEMVFGSPPSPTPLQRNLPNSSKSNGGGTEALLLSEMYFFWRRPNTLWGRLWANISHLILTEVGVQVVLYSSSPVGVAEVVLIPSPTRDAARELYCRLAPYSIRMGNPSGVLPISRLDWWLQRLRNDRHQNTSTPLERPDPKTISPSTLPHSLSTEEEARWCDRIFGELDGHRFGLLNGLPIARSSVAPSSETELLATVFGHIQAAGWNWRLVDEILWRLVSTWIEMPANLGTMRCSCLLLINRSDSILQLQRIELVIGRALHILGNEATGYDRSARILAPNGHILLFTTTSVSSPLDEGRLSVRIQGASFLTIASDTQRESKCEASNGRVAGFLEKTVTEWWSKFVVLVS